MTQGGCFQAFETVPLWTRMPPNNGFQSDALHSARA
jgi:hypothetical protein